MFERYAGELVSSPDILLKDRKNAGTIFAVEKLPDTNLNVVILLVLDTDESSLKNSVMTFYRIRDKNLKKLMERNPILYIRE